MSGTTWTVTRGAESTTPVAHTAGFTVVQVVSAGDLGGVLQAGNNLADVASATTAKSNLGLLTDFAPTGLAGATAASRYAGATTSGAPGSGTFAVGDYVIDRSGKVWICTAAGTPGTWTQSGETLPLTTLGDTLYEDATPALARLPGNTSATKNFLTQTGTGSASAAPAWGTIAAADLPAASTSTQGAVIVDGTASDIQPDGVAAAGTKGQAADAKHVHPYQAWQFLPEAYGAKRDGKYLYDASMNSSSAVLTTAGLPAPSAPSLSSGSGTVGAGTYQVKVTYVNQYGETLASTSTSVTVGASASITVTSPLPWTNATAYYVYCTQAGGSTYTRQQAPGSPTQLRINYTISAPPTNTGAAPPVANTSNSAPFTSGDVGKAIIVPSAGGFLNVPLVTTIASFQSATQVTLAANATRSVSGNGAVYGTDDTSAIQQAINAAVAYAQTAGKEQATGEVIFGDGIYCVAGPLTGSLQNAQLTIPYNDPYVGPKVNLKLTGVQESSGPVHWEQPNPPAAGTTIASIYYNDSGSPPTPNPAVIGGPVTNFGGIGGLFSNMRVIVDGLNVLVAYRCSISGLDLYGVGQADIKSFSYFAMARTLGAAAGGWPPYIIGSGNPSPWGTFGYRCPTVGNNDQNDVDRLTVYGPYHGVIFCDHFTAASIKIIFCFNAATASGTGASHHCFISSLSSEATSLPLVNDGGTTVPIFVASLHMENADFVITDPSNLFYGEVRAEQAGTPPSPPGLVGAGKNGAANVRLLWDLQPLGLVGSPPAVPASTVAFTNTYWRDAYVIVTGGVVSDIALDGASTGLTSGTILLRSGGTITLTYTAAPSWNWWLL